MTLGLASFLIAAAISLQKAGLGRWWTARRKRPDPEIAPPLHGPEVG